MNVYIEYVIADNFVLTYLIASLSYVLLKLKRSKIRCVAVACIGTVVAVAYPFIGSNVIVIIVKILLALLLGVILFVKKTSILLGIGAFLGVTLFFGGAVSAIGYIINGKINGALRNISDIPIALIIAVSYVLALIVKKAIVKFSKRADVENRILDVEMVVFGKRFELRGLMDTGNCLYDNISGLPIIVVKAACIAEIFTDEQLQSIVMGQAERTVKKSHYVSIGTVGKENSKLLVIEPDSFKVVNSKLNKRDVMVGISFVANYDSEQYDAILHPAVV